MELPRRHSFRRTPDKSNACIEEVPDSTALHCTAQSIRGKQIQRKNQNVASRVLFVSYFNMQCGPDT